MKVICFRAAILLQSMILSGVVVADEVDDIVAASNMQQHWTERIAGPAVAGYVEREGSTYVKAYGESQAKEIIAEEKSILEGALTWDEARPMLVGAYRSCDKSALTFILRSALKQPIDPGALTDDLKRKLDECQRTAVSEIQNGLHSLMANAQIKMDEARKRFKPL